MKDLVLIVLPSPFLFSPQSMFPLGLLYVAAAAEKAGLDVGICDLSLGLRSEDIPLARAYGISATTPQAKLLDEAIDLIYKDAPNKTPVFLGGAHVTADGRDEQRENTIICRGEVDGWFGAAISDVLMFGRGACSITGEPVADLDKLPLPAWHLLKLRHYGQSLAGYWTGTVLGARGCSGRCAFCSKEVFGNRQRRRSVDNILAEVEILKGFGYRAIHFLDDNMIVSAKELIALCLGMKSLSVYWKCLLRTDTVVDKLGKTAIELMAECGCLEIAYGIESGSQDVLDKINKGTTVEKNTDAVKWTEASGIVAKAFLVAGLPGESADTMRDTKQWFEHARPSNYSLSCLRPFKGSPIADRPADFGMRIIETDPVNYSYRGKGELVAVAGTEFLSAAEITKLANQLDRYLGRLTHGH